MIAEEERCRPLVCGLQIINWDSALRAGFHRTGTANAGTLGCFVELTNGNVALLSNNHVIANRNRGERGRDRILQPGPIVSGGRIQIIPVQIAVLRDFEDIQASPPNVMPYTGRVVFNEIDAAVAELNEGISFKQGYLPFRKLAVPRHASAGALPGDRVFKVGCTTGLTFGEVVDIMTQVGPVIYDHVPCWFRRSIVIEGLNGSRFSDHGDSGSVVVRSNGEVIGLLYAGNRRQTYACPIDVVLQSLGCTLA